MKAMLGQKTTAGEDTRMKIEVHLLTHDGELGQMLEWSLRHYLAFADKVVVHDGGPMGKSADWIKVVERDGLPIFKCPVEVKPWETSGELNDDLARKLKNECWRGTDADWVIVADMDELVWSPLGMRRRLAQAREAGAAVLRPRGFEMFSDHWFDANDYASVTQITDLVPFGSPDDKWYAKPIVFSPKLVADSGFGIGAHESRPVLKDGRVFHCGPDWPFAERLALLHYKSIFGGLERIAARYDATRKRLSAVNLRQGWGNVHDSGLVHAQKKRDLLLPGVTRVVGGFA
jgi:hypothetical protein